MLYNHQQRIINENPEKRGLWWSTGTGKTRAASEWIIKNYLDTLIVCPKSLKTIWEREMGQYSNHIILTKETFRRDWNSIPRYKSIVIDEAHYFFHEKSAMSKSLLKYIKKQNPERILLLTATPHNGKSHFMVYVISEILGKKLNFLEFRRVFYYQMTLGKRIIWQPRQDPGTIERVHNLLRVFGDVVKLEDCVDVPASIFETEFFDLTPEQRAEVKNIKQTEFNHMTCWGAISQVCGGTRKGDDFIADWFYKSEKMDRVKELITENKKLIIVCHYNLEIDKIKQLSESLGKQCFVIRGDIPNRQEVVDSANLCDDCVVIINGACSEGYGLQTFPLMVFYSYSFTLKDYTQIIGRIQRINAVQKCVYLSLVVKDTIDEDIFNNIMGKQDFQIKLYNRGAKELCKNDN
jgi:superfamily II DNA or RNA helicase